MIYEDPDDLGYTADQDHEWPEFCDEHAIAYEECPECGGEGLLRHPDHGPQPCMNCWETGLIEHTCPTQQEGIEGGGQ